MEGKVYFDLTTLTINTTGNVIYAWELCHRLMRLAQPLQIIPYTCPFPTINKKGIERSINAALRYSVSDRLLASMGLREKDIFIIPTQNVPSSIYQHTYATIVHDLAAWHDPSITTRGGKNFARSLPKSIQKAKYIFAVSDYTAQDIANEFGIPLDKIIIAPCGLSSLYHNEALTLEKINGISLLPQQYLLHTGSFGKQKNISFVIEVYEKFKRSIQDIENPVKLVLTGAQKLQTTQTILQRIKSSPYANDIVVLGRVKSKEMPALYKGAIALVFPSTFEGFGMPVIEAISQGTPALINANTSLTQFKNFGATVFNHFDIQLWNDRLISIFKNKQRVDIADINRIKDYFNWDRTAQIVWNAIANDLI